jgi:transposase
VNAVEYDANLFPKTAGFLASRGATIAEIADALGVTTRCVYNWLNQYPALQPQ